jgi:hypothetical protein
MFGTLRYLPEKKVGEFLERESGVAEDGATNKPQHSACDNCRIKKVCYLKFPCRSCNHILGSKSLIQMLEMCGIDPLQRPKSGLFAMQNSLSPL